METLRASWEVTAGLVPEQPMPEFTKQFHLTSEEWDGGSEKGVLAFQAKQGAAAMYALSLQNPSILNYVRLDWIWY